MVSTLHRLSLAAACTVSTFVFAQSPTPSDIPAPSQDAAAVASPVLPAKVVKFRVLQLGNGRPIRRAEIKVGEDKFYSDPEGKFDLTINDAVPRIIVSRVGFQTQSVRTEEVAEGDEYDIFLPPAIGGDDVVVVQGKRRTGVSRKTISVAEASKVAPAGDPGQVTKLMPGVQQSTFGSEVIIRGSEPTDSKYYIDDIEVPFLYHPIGSLTIIPAPLISDVEFSAGGFGAEYGDALGGVISVRTKTEVPEFKKTIFQLNFPIYSSVYHERPLSQSEGVSVSARYSYVDKVLDKFLPADSGVTVTPVFSDSQIVYTHLRSDGHDKVTALAASNGLKLIFPGGLSTDESGNASFGFSSYTGALGWERNMRLSNELSYTTTPQVYYFKTRFNVADNKLFLRVWQVRAPLELTLRLNKDDKLFFGADPSYSWAAIDYVVPRFDPKDPFFDFEEAPKERGTNKDTVQKHAAWISLEKKFGDFILTPGLRAFYLSQTNRADIDPRFAARYALSSISTLKASVGQYSRAPEPGEADKQFGNDRLLFERANHYIAGVDNKWSDKWETDFQVFQKRGYRIVRNDADPDVRYNNEGGMDSRGVETFIRRNKTSRGFGWLSYTYSINKERASEDEEWVPSQYDQTHVLTLASGYQVFPTWDLGGRFKYNTGNTYTPQRSAVYNANYDKYQPRSDGSGINSGRLPAYHELSLFSNFEGLAESWKGALRLGIEYYWFKRQAFGVQNNYDYTKETYATGIPLPYIELRGEF